MLRGSTVLVTGGGGFIGSHIVEDLLRRGARVRVLDDWSCGHRDNLAKVAGDIELVEGSILDKETLARAVRGCDLVSHQAAQLEIFKSTDDPEVDLEINTVGTLNVLRAAREAGARKVVNASSACVYGQVEGSVSEERQPWPNWCYGVSKLAAERYGKIWNDYHGLPVTSLRYGIVYGEREWYRRVLTIFMKRVLDGKSPVVFGRGDQVRDFVHVSCVVRLHALCLERDEANGQVYNVGTGEPTTVVELARAVASLVDRPPPVAFEDVPEGAFSTLAPEKRRNAAELKVMLLDSSKAARELGWRSEVPLADGLRRELEWVRGNRHRWERVQTAKPGAHA